MINTRAAIVYVLWLVGLSNLAFAYENKDWLAFGFNLVLLIFFAVLIIVQFVIAISGGDDEMWSEFKTDYDRETAVRRYIYHTERQKQHDLKNLYPDVFGKGDDTEN